MFKREEFNHERFEELCALAALGQISPDEYADLRAHLAVCDACRSSRRDYLEILHEHLPLVASEESCSSSSNVAFHDSSYRQRFLQRTQSQGVLPATGQGERATARTRSGSQGRIRLAGAAGYGLPVAAALLMVALGLSGLQWYQSRERAAVAATNLIQLRQEIEQLKGQISGRSQEGLPAVDPSPIAAAPSAAVTIANAEVDRHRMEEELARARRERQLALADSLSQRQRLKESQAEAADLRKALEEARFSETHLSEKLALAEQALQTRTHHVRALQQKDSTQLVTIATQKSQIGELVRKLGEQSQIINRERELLAAGRDIRDLMGARNLHIIDVADVDGSGARRSLGRVFYTEGKSLIFYAYDMQERKRSLEKFSLQAWGQRGATRSTSAESLGIFFTDDKSENRWMLKYDDPKVLAQIDAVFVTLEPKGGSSKPQGQKLMYAYLKANPNHP